MEIDQLLLGFVESEQRRLGERALVLVDHVEGEGPVIHIRSRDGLGCEVTVHAEDDHRIVLRVGKASVVEIWRSRESMDYLIDLARQWLFVASEGRISETTWTRGETIVSSQLVARLDDQTISTRTGNLLARLFAHKETHLFTRYS